ncbi:IS110 family transposase [Sulfitobacter pontiacus]|jgi:transposase|uniref:IS110 family transposase n=1 Tax=Sulfitobacter pontiacus TaxID=60137 RepID=UPI00241F982F|nr:IS110 family transposase [Sulfitobacter pontiacus]HJO51568.1 IS110 family transposase [Sulfitobacter pontiacus]|tara:strand:- start:422 stop:1450 length:1029 start_codon:yes stop_codon:yes gene_type:complete
MEQVTIVGLDLAKRVFQVHGATADGGIAIRKKLSRGQVLAFFADLPPCVVAMEACATAHYWAREIGALGHNVRLVPPAYVKPFVKRQKNDAADAEAIAEAASRPTMRFVEPKSPQQQARAMVFRTRDLFVRQRTQTINALRAHLAEHGLIAPQGMSNLANIRRFIDEAAAEVEPLVVETAHTYLEQIDDLSSRILKLEATLKQEAARTDASSRMMTMPGVGPITAMAIEAFAPSLCVFRRSRDFAAWLGLVPRQHSTGGKQVLGRTSKMGQRDIRRLLIIGAMSVIRWATRKGTTPGTWLHSILLRKPRKVAAIALANKMARTLWAMETRKEDYRDPRLTAA